MIGTPSQDWVSVPSLCSISSGGKYAPLVISSSSVPSKSGWRVLITLEVSPVPTGKRLNIFNISAFVAVVFKIGVDEIA